jgi:hypothetical protein
MLGTSSFSHAGTRARRSAEARSRRSERRRDLAKAVVAGSDQRPSLQREEAGRRVGHNDVAHLHADMASQPVHAHHNWEKRVVKWVATDDRDQFAVSFGHAQAHVLERDMSPTGNGTAGPAAPARMASSLRRNAPFRMRCRRNSRRHRRTRRPWARSGWRSGPPATSSTCLHPGGLLHGAKTTRDRWLPRSRRFLHGPVPVGGATVAAGSSDLRRGSRRPPRPQDLRSSILTAARITSPSTATARSSLPPSSRPEIREATVADSLVEDLLAEAWASQTTMTPKLTASSGPRVQRRRP